MAEGLDALPGFSVDLATVQTNMVYVATDRPATEVVSELSSNGIDAFDTGPHTVRLVVHLHITDEDIERLLAVCKSM